MRLKCEVNIVMRPVTGCLSLKSHRPCQAIITIGKEGCSTSPTTTITLLISTASNRNGTKFLLSRNILKLYTHFIADGKLTISLSNPASDVCLSKADPQQLKSVVNLLRMVSRGDGSRCASLSNMRPPSCKGMRNLQSVMVITSRKDYPVTTHFPPGLRSVTVNHCNLKRMDPRIGDLHLLCCLSLANNCLTTLPDNAVCWSSLSQLDLSSNRLSTVPKALFVSSLKVTLSVLKMNSNGLQVLPSRIYEMCLLTHLHVDDNLLASFPSTFGLLPKLSVVSAQRNHITRLPASMSKLRLEYIDLFGNPIGISASTSVLEDNLHLLTLKEMSARAIRSSKLDYRRNGLPASLEWYLDNNARMCWCGRYCFESCAKCVRTCPLSTICSTVKAWDVSGRTSVPIELYVCSKSCLAKFLINSYLYWR